MFSSVTRKPELILMLHHRLLTCGTIEEKIFQRQLSKAGLSGAVVDPQKQSKIKLSNEELKVTGLRDFFAVCVLFILTCGLTCFQFPGSFHFS